MSWARLLKRVFDIDIEQCSQCSGTLKIIAAIVDPTVIAKILVCCFFMNVHYLVGLWVCGHQGWMFTYPQLGSPRNCFGRVYLLKQEVSALRV